MKILSLDGGGVRGIISAVWLREIANKLNSPLYEYFNFISGTSTGSLLAIGIAADLDPTSFVDLYLNKASDVFETSRLKRFFIRTKTFFTDGFSAPKYSDKGLNHLLKSLFGDIEFGDMKTNVMIPTYNITTQRPYFFKSWKEEHKHIPAWEIARASSAAPSFLPSWKINKNEFVDGGIAGVNNPLGCAIAEAIRLGNKPKDITACSLGTGHYNPLKNNLSTKHWGLAEWAKYLIPVLMDGSSDISTYHAQMILNKDKFYRFQMPISKKLSNLDNADERNLKRLIRLSDRYIKRVEIRNQLRKMLGEI